MKAMILAAGLGTRLRPLTHVLPKPMAPVVNRPVMEHIVVLVRDHGFTEIVTNISHLPDLMREHFGDGSDFGIQLTWSEEKELLGTAGGVRNARDHLGHDFLTISGDALTDLDLSAMRDFHESHDGIATLATRRVADTSQFGVVITGEDRRVQGFQEKPDPAEALSDLANCGIYMFRGEIFDYFPEPGTSAAADPDSPAGFADWAMDVFPALLENDIPFYAHEVEAYWNDIGSVHEYLNGNFDALAGEVSLSWEEAEVAEGIWAGEGSNLNGCRVKPPVLIGAGCELGAGADLQGPVVVGAGSRVGAGTRLRECVLLAGAEVPAGGVLAGGVGGIARR